MMGAKSLVLDDGCWMMGVWLSMRSYVNLINFISKGNDMIDNFIGFIIQN